jgi:drug/metabolite transporter (DMT)-like permease
MLFSNKYYFVLLIIAILLVSATQVLFKVIADKHRDLLLGVIYDYRLYIALIIYTIAFALWIVALSKIDFSIAIPLNIITIVFGGVFGYYIFGESISTLKIISYIIISFGVVLLAYDSLKI